MDRHRAYSILSDRISALANAPLEDLRGRIDTTSTDRVRTGGNDFIVDVHLTWVDAQKSAIRIKVTVDSSSSYRMERLEEKLIRVVSS